MKKILFTLLFVFTCGCITSSLPTICDQVTGESYLCQVAKEKNIRLEDIGTGIVIVNTIAIKKGYIDADSAEMIILSILEILEEPITYIVFKNCLDYHEKEFPELLTIVKEYSSLFAANKLIYEEDKKIIRNWLNTQLEKF